MTREESIRILENGNWWNWLDDIRGDAEDLMPLYDAIDLAVEALKENPSGWISVKDRLPEIGEKVLTLDKWGHIHDRTLYQFDGIPKTTLFRPDGLAPGKDITHWQSLPEPPKREEGEKSK